MIPSVKWHKRKIEAYTSKTLHDVLVLISTTFPDNAVL